MVTETAGTPAGTAGGTRTAAARVQEILVPQAVAAEILETLGTMVAAAAEILETVETAAAETAETPGTTVAAAAETVGTLETMAAEIPETLGTAAALAAADAGWRCTATASGGPSGARPEDTGAGRNNRNKKAGGRLCFPLPFTYRAGAWPENGRRERGGVI